MSLLNISSIKFHSTVLANVRFFISMSPFMISQVAMRRKCLYANLALEWLFSCVSSHVDNKVGHLNKRFLALRISTDEWSYALVAQ